MKVKDARQAGKISTGNTKMPGTTFAIDAFACITGSKLAKIAKTLRGLVQIGTNCQNVTGAYPN